MEASRSNLGMSLRPSVLRHTVNLRKRVTLLLPENLAGNFMGYFTSRAEESLIDLKDLASKIRKGSEQVKEKYAAKVGFDSKETCQELEDHYRDLIDNEDIDNYNCPSFCRFTFYETHFGWGKPAWVSFASFPIKNVIVVMVHRMILSL
ncbi:deacetylvindoline O-acetyltransferase-like [Prunus avium]|uniref:Deacetylvindoline O-acetyltransferase-like n=1 Tax=Prunus avium TaxID=42229 RepID=A0A6P5TVA6_PRUAV|nr:deacetylvindoline O-acetyltransferase-like [Prunus avium]XP_021831718.1 deacetylvindoline O-acetyltransferase-like [Prunus avium]